MDGKIRAISRTKIPFFVHYRVQTKFVSSFLQICCDKFNRFESKVEVHWQRVKILKSVINIGIKTRRKQMQLPLTGEINLDLKFQAEYKAHSIVGKHRQKRNITA